MSGKEKKNTFTKKILFLSSFRKNKKLNRIKEEHFTSETPGIENVSETFVESAQGLDTTLCLDSLGHSVLEAAGGECTPGEDTATDITALGLSSAYTSPVDPAKSERRSFSNLRSAAADHPDVLRHLNSPGIQRLHNANPMSVSNDSGIDCNILLSERTSPEQFVAFTRRESERIRQEQLQNLNESVLETLTEVSIESKGTDDDDTTNIEPDANESVFDAACREDLAGAASVSLLQEQIEKTKKEVDLLAELKAVLSEKLDAVENRPCDRGILSHEPRDNADSDVNETASATSDNIPSDETSLKFVESHRNDSTSNHLASVGDELLDNQANKTDETKTEEVRKRLEDELRESQLSGLQIDVPHTVVSPIPMTLASSVPANHRALNASKVSGTLIPNEKSAFAKCKSIKRSVSDVGKGILGRFRHKKRDHNISSREDAYLCDADTTLNNTKTRFKKSRSLRFSKSKKHQLFNSSQISLNDTDTYTDSRVNERKDRDIFSRSSIDISQSERSANFNPSEASFSRRERNLKSKPLQSSSPRGDDVEIWNRRGRRSRPTGEESIQDLTLSICEMTSALLGRTGSQSNSAESIACACDCQNRNADPQCCEKRKTPSPVNTASNNLPFCDLVSKPSSGVPIQETNYGANKLLSNGGGDLDTTVHDLDASYLDGVEDDRTCEVETESDSECSDSDCSECCSNRGYRDRGKSTTDTSSSDTTPPKCCSPVCDIDTATGQRLSDVGNSQSSSSSRSTSFSSDSRPSTPEQCRRASQHDTADCVQSPYSVSFTELNDENSCYFESKLNSSHSFNNQSFHEVYSDSQSPLRRDNGATGGSKPYSPCVFPYGDTPASSPVNDSFVSSPSSPPFAARPSTACPAGLNQRVDVRRRNAYTNTNLANKFNVNDSICLARRERFSSHHELDTSLGQSILDNSQQNSSFQRHSRTSFNNSIQFSPSRSQSVQSRGYNFERKDTFWVERHIGQVYSPAKRVLHKNRGLSESDLCKQILDLYVNDADESGLEPHNSELSFDESFSQPVQEPVSSDDDSVLQFGTYVAPRHVVKETNIDDFSTSNIRTCYTAKAKTRKLQGDATTSLLRGDDRRKAAVSELKRAMQTPLPSSPDDIPMSRSAVQRGRHMNTSLPHDVYSHPKRRQNMNCSLQHITVADLNTSLKTSSRRFNTSLQHMSTSDLKTSRRKQSSQKQSRSQSANSLLNVDSPGRKHSREQTIVSGDNVARASKYNKVDRRDRCSVLVDEDREMAYDKLSSKFHDRPALKDRTNTKPVHLSSLEMPSVCVDLKAESPPLAGKENEDQSLMSDHHFDRLVLLHTAHNGQQKVRCLSLREAQSVVKHYPPPKEATMISWGQNLSEVDLSRHTPRKTPVHTKPILLQRGDTYPYDEDRPSPIVITKKRKLKISSKKYKKWPW